MAGSKIRMTFTSDVHRSFNFLQSANTRAYV